MLCVAPLVGPVPPDDLPQGSEVFGVLPRVLAAGASGIAATAVVVMAVVSAWRVLRGRSRGRAAAAVARPGRLAAGNGLIALGTLVLGASGTLNGRLGAEQAFSVTLVIGIVLLFAGFLVATTANSRSKAVPLAWVSDADWAADWANEAPVGSARQDEELQHRGAQDADHQQDEGEGDGRSHRLNATGVLTGPRGGSSPNGTSTTWSPAASPSSAPAERRSRATDTRP